MKVKVGATKKTGLNVVLVGVKHPSKLSGCDLRAGFLDELFVSVHRDGAWLKQD